MKALVLNNSIWLNSHYEVQSCKGKRKKIKSKRENIFRKKPKDKVRLFILDLKLLKREGQRKAFNRHRIPESSRGRKINFPISSILTTSRNARNVDR